MRSFFCLQLHSVGEVSTCTFFAIKAWHMVPDALTHDCYVVSISIAKETIFKDSLTMMHFWDMYNIYIYIHGCSVVRGQSFHHLKLLWISLDDIELAVWFWVLHFHLGSWSPSGSYFWDRWLNHQADTSANVRVISGGLFHGGNPDLLGLVGLWSQHLQDH